MFADARSVPADSTVEADLCIVGAGPAGITLARRFAGGPLRVVVLESGGFEVESDTQSLYEGPEDGLPYFPLQASRLRYFGGTSGHWGGTCRPLEPADFEPRDGVPESGWPIRRADLDPYYPEAQRLVGVGDMDWSTKPWADGSRFGPFDLDGKVETRVGRLVRKKDRRWGTLYREDIERARNVRTILHANVTELETDEAGGRVRRARVATLHGKRFSVEARWFILATGGIENARVLLLSDRHQPGGLGNQHGLVGRYFTEHPRFKGAVLVPSSSTLDGRFYTTHRVGDVDVEGYLALPAARQREEGLVDVQIGLRPVYQGRFEGIEDADDVKALEDDHDVKAVATDLMTWHRFTVPGAPLPVPYPEVVGKLAGSNAERKGLIPEVLGDIAAFAYTKFVGSAPLRHLELVTRIASAPERDSRITLVRDRDALGLRKAKLTWALNPIDRRSVVRSLELVGAAVGAAGMGRLRILVDEDDRKWPEDLAGGWHHMGTTRMSDDPAHGVVDRNCKVHGLANLYVAGSSVFPTPGSGTPTMTIVALALRLARHLEGVVA